MFVGSTGPVGVNHMTLEVLENAVDLVLGGRATSISVVCHDDQSVEVSDDGPGLDLSDELVREYFEERHDSATADGHSPHIHLWTAPLGLFVINALSSRLVVDSTHAGVRRVHEWSAGGDHHRMIAEEQDAKLSSRTKIRFWPDPEIFSETSPQADVLAKRLDELTWLLPELDDLEFVVRRTNNTDGLVAMMDSRLRRRMNTRR